MNFCKSLSGSVFVGYASLAIAQLSVATIGPMFAFLEGKGVAATLAVSWRVQVMSLLLIIPASIEYHFLKPELKALIWDWKVAGYPSKYTPLPVIVSGAGFCWFLGLTCWVASLEFLSTTTASIIATTTPIIMVIYLKLRGENIGRAVWLGVAIAFTGCIVATLGNADVEADHVEKPSALHSFFGFALAMISSIAQVPSILLGRAGKARIPLFLYGLLTTMVVVICSILISFVIVPGASFSNDVNGIFGWVSHEFFMYLLIFGLVTAFCTICCYNYALNFVSPVVFSVVGLIDSFGTGLISWIFGIEGVPPLMVWIGGFISIIGGYIVVINEYKRTKAEDAKALASDAADGDTELAGMDLTSIDLDLPTTKGHYTSSNSNLQSYKFVKLAADADDTLEEPEDTGLL